MSGHCDYRNQWKDDHDRMGDAAADRNETRGDVRWKYRPAVMRGVAANAQAGCRGAGGEFVSVGNNRCLSSERGRAVEFGGGPFGSSWVDGELCSHQGASLRKSKTLRLGNYPIRGLGTITGTGREGAGEGRHLQRSQQFRGCVRGRQSRHQSIAGNGRSRAGPGRMRAGRNAQCRKPHGRLAGWARDETIAGGDGAGAANAPDRRAPL